MEYSDVVLRVRPKIETGIPYTYLKQLKKVLQAGNNMFGSKEVL